MTVDETLKGLLNFIKNDSYKGYYLTKDRHSGEICLHIEYMDTNKKNKCISRI